MAVVSHAVSPVNCPQYRDGGGGATTSSGGNMAAAASSERIEGSGSVSRVIEEKIYVAVGKDFKKNKSLVIWALHNSGGKSICILHVHQPAQMIPLALMGTKFHASSLKEEEVRAYREIERKEMHEMLEDYLVLCRQMGVRSEKLCTEMGSIEKGILELISQHGIRKLVMGAASDKRYSKNMTEIKSKKSTCVRLQAPASCHIWFICKQYLIYTKEATLVESDTEEFRPFSQPASPNVETGQSNHLRSQSITLGQSNQPRLTNPVQDLFRRAHSVTFGRQGGKVSTFLSSDNVGRPSTSQSRPDAEGALSVSSDELDTLSRSTSQGSVLSTCSSNGTAVLGMAVKNVGRRNGAELSVLHQPKEDLSRSSPPSVLVGSIEDPLYDQLEQAMVEADSSRREAFDAAFRRAKAERDAIDAIRRAKASETLYADESRQRKEIEEALAKEKEELEKKQKERDKIMEEHHTAMEQKNRLESQIADADQMAKELEQKIISAVQLLQNYKKERDELQMERDNALKEAEELRKSRAEASSSQMPRFFSEFSFSEIEEATSNFNQSLKIGEGGYGSIYKGLLRHTQVAIKALHSNSLQGPAEFQQEVDVLSKMRHPNLVTLIGACPEAWTLIYEYLPNGSLEDRLSCRDNSPPLSWQTRIRIATELCSVLIFLHSSKPHSIVHGDLKPANVLLDSKFVSKLSDFGICRLLSQNEGSSNNTTLCCITDPKGTFAYMDPEFLASGELTPKSDVYSFGIILLRLLTGRPALGITKEVQYALDKGNLTNLLDPLAGDWPFVQAEQLARLALRCCEMNRKSRPDLVSDVWRVLEPMKASCGGSSCFRLGAEEHCQPPPYFICPIFQEVMQDPHVAADGFTYEAEALRGWLDSGHENSPMTNVKLTHNHLVPNHALRSAIQEWLQEK
ncbi:U-box domain-containing protein 33-like isoform X1 [Mercurialis annua]|uniref:U-box domain-containing protein 33-like isoform X1 n=1 Tax=Mercurialis annua TaxID=3986 RepID=UPI00215F3C6B|nr:U-box domain-containing protein 33-like isoform X1 [Mercurialis annua]